MRIRIWNAFASNNSGSYVIVGAFPSEALAAEVAAELGDVVRAHSRWMAAQRDEPTETISPLATYAAPFGVTYRGEAWDGEWPEHADELWAWAIGHQVFVHAPFTISMPRALGHLIYERGGRVTTEIDHAHHPLIATFEIYVDHRGAELQALADALASALDAHRRPEIAPVWRGRLHGEHHFLEPDLAVAAAFTDLVAGFTAIAEVVRRFAGQLTVRVSESTGD